MTPRSGLLIVDKPAGPTSFDVVARVRRALGVKKAGHAGTLDPAATGVLVICLEDAVRLQHFLTDDDKAYRATIAFGAATDTEDGEGRVVAEGDPAGLTEAAVRAKLLEFLGEIDQVPPMFSAVRVGGRRLHEAARAGEVVDRAPRRVRIDSLELVSLGDVDAGCRVAVVDVRCGKGTYVRTLAADLGRALGVPAHLAALRRTRASGFGIEEAVPLSEFEGSVQVRGVEAAAARIIPAALALRGVPEVRVSAEQAQALAHGRAIAVSGEDRALVRVVGEHASLVAMGRVEGGRLRPLKVFASPAPDAT